MDFYALPFEQFAEHRPWKFNLVDDVEALNRLVAREAVDAIRAAIEHRRPCNLIHLASGVKVDLFPKGDTPFDELELTRREIEVLAALCEQKGRIVSRRSLLNEVWGYPDPERVETRTVDMHIAKLRKKLDGQGHSLIETIRGEGYRYTG